MRTRAKGPNGRSLSWFQKHEAARIIATPPPPPLEGMLVHRRVTSQRREIEFKACKDTARRKRDFLPHSIFPILS